MSGIVETLLAVAGFGRPSKPPPQRRRTASARPRPVAPGAARRRSDSQAGHPEAFGGAGTAAPAPVAPSRRMPVAAVPSRRTRRFNGVGMLLLASMFLAFGGWMGSQVQALALGVREPIQLVDPNVMRPLEGPAYTF